MKNFTTALLLSLTLAVTSYAFGVSIYDCHTKDMSVALTIAHADDDDSVCDDDGVSLEFALDGREYAMLMGGVLVDEHTITATGTTVLHGEATSVTLSVVPAQFDSYTVAASGMLTDQDQVVATLTLSSDDGDDTIEMLCTAHLLPSAFIDSLVQIP